MKNILLLFAKLNPEIRYVQGMNEVLAPLYYVLSTDHEEKNSVRNFFKPHDAMIVVIFLF